MRFPSRLRRQLASVVSDCTRLASLATAAAAAAAENKELLGLMGDGEGGRDALVPSLANANRGEPRAWLML